MDSPTPPKKPSQLLDDLELIRELLDDDNPQQPPLLTDSLDLDSIPLLSDVISPSPNATTATWSTALQHAVQEIAQPPLPELNAELYAAAQLILQEVIDDFVPRIESELKQRLEARLPRLLSPLKP